jgi:carboxyl-terminal processing protease
MPPDELTDFEIALKLSLEGIGAVLTSDDGFTVIQSLVPGGQAAKTGQLRPKDKIIAVAQENEAPVPTIDMDLSDVVKMIRGKKGTRVSLTVLREGKTTSTFIVSIVRDKIDVSSQAAKITYQTHKVGERTVKLGILELPSFYGGERGGRSSYEDVKRLLAEARAQKVDGIVLDLSRNGGGLLDDAVRISGLFIKRGAVVGTKSADGKLSVLDDTDANVEWAGPLVVVISHASASASEIVAGALHDYHRAIIVGSEKTFGKGTVQVVVPMPSEIGAIRVTTGMFFLPGGDSTQLKGVPSDVAVPSVFDGFNLGEDKLEYALPAQSVPSFVSTAANGNGGDDHWEPVPQAIVASLAERSKARVAAEPAFAKIREQLQDLAKNKDPVHLGDLRKRSSKDKTAPAATHNTKGPGAKDRNAGKGSKNDTGDMADDDTQVDSQQQAVVNEGANILADAIGAGLGRPLAAAR